jgi:hypothetical protein
MWEIYTSRNQGIAVRSTLDALSNAFPQAAADDPPSNILKAGLVEYMALDHQEPSPGGLEGERDVLRKRRWYDYEKEVRTFRSDVKNWVEPFEGFAWGAYRSAGVWVKCELKTLINSVIMAPKSLPYMESAVQKVLELFGFDAKLVEPSSLNEAILPPDPVLVRQEWSRQSGS